MLSSASTFRCFALAVVLACGAAAQAQQIERGGILRVGLEADFPTFDPMHMGALVERSVAKSFYETLFTLSENGEIEPLLAESWDLSEDGRVYTIELREGIRFHDGTPFNAEAVVTNFERLLDPKNGCRCISEISSVQQVEAVAPHTVRFTLHEANASLPAVLADVSGMQISPRALRDSSKSFATHPVGTGPFRLQSWNRGVALKVERNPDYWRKDLPYLDGVVYRPIPDTQTRMSSLLAGDIHISTVPAPEDVDAVRKGRHLNLKVVEAPGLGTIFTMFNTRREPFSDARVRQALFHATDRETINTAINRGIYPLTANPFGAGLWTLPNDFPAYNSDKARELLAAYGKPVRFTLSATATPTAVRQALVLQQLWKRVGVEVDIQQLEQRQLVSQAVSSDFDAMLFRWSGRADPDLNSFQFFHSESPRNYTQYSSPAMDRLLQAGRMSPNRDERKRIYQEVGERLASEGPYLFMWSANYFFIVNEKVNNLAPVPGGIPEVDEVWLEQQ